MSEPTIEQLLSRYWDGLTTPDEEERLIRFYAQAEDELPAGLAPYRAYFLGLYNLRRAHLDESFDERLLARLEGGDEAMTCPEADHGDNVDVVRARRITILTRFLPILRATAVVAVVVVVGGLVQRTFTPDGKAEAPMAVSADTVGSYPSAPSVALQEGVPSAISDEDRERIDSLRCIQLSPAGGGD